MWVPREAISENVIETGGMWSSGPLFIGKISSPSLKFPIRPTPFCDDTALLF
jgi:hypothetical protein